MDQKVPGRDALEEKIAFVVGTRPDIIKMSPVITEAKRREQPSFVVHAGQHYSEELDDWFFRDLALDNPDYRISGAEKRELHGEQIAAMLSGIEEILLEELPRIVLVYGDTHACLAGALAARNLGMVVGHVEAGLRSGDWRMPEEHNRVMVDHISDILFAPTETAAENAREDGVAGDVHVTGNTIVDALELHEGIAATESDILSQLGLDSGGYFLTTVHREENVDDETSLARIVEALERVAARFDHEIVFPVHPRTSKMLESFGLLDRLTACEAVTLIEPLGYLDFLQLLTNASLVLTDSGGIQEEACVLRVPCVTVRENTERPETVDIGANVLAGNEPERVVDRVGDMLARQPDWSNPFGDGAAAERIVSKAVCRPSTWDVR